MRRINNLLFGLLLLFVAPHRSYSFNTNTFTFKRPPRCHKYSTIHQATSLLPTRRHDIKSINLITELRESSTSTNIDKDTDNEPGTEEDNALNENSGLAATNTINERLLAEVQEAERRERTGAKSAAGKKLGLDGYGRSRKTDEEVKAAIAEARDLNGVNPIVAIGGSFFAFGVAAVLWVATNKLGTFFAGHPPATEVYFVQRTAQVFRNVVVGLVSLASGFFGVTGLGIFGMGVRVAYGVMTGELDPTPIKQRTIKTKDTVNMSSMLDLMMNKKPGRRGGKK